MSDEYFGLQEQFGSLDWQLEASLFGMWVFLATEVLFFGALFTGFTVYRALHAQAFSDGYNHMIVWIGTVNTGVLLTSSFTTALAVRASKFGQRRQLVALLCATVLLAGAFMGLKGLEYYMHWQDHLWPGHDFHYPGPAEFARPVRIYFAFYYVMTGFHAAHVGAGMLVISTLAWRAWQGRYTAKYFHPVEVAGIYWHFVDIVWIFLYPVLYLMKIKGV